MNVVVVGAGPAGLISSLFLIQAGIKPLILEKQSTINSSACGEGCAMHSLNKIPFNSNKYICKTVKGAKLIYADGTCSYTSNPSAILDRTNWLRGMAQAIVDSGGQVLLNSEVAAIEEDYIFLKNGEKIGYEILLGADGPHSLVARYLGIKHQYAITNQYKVAYDASDMDYLELYVDRKFSHGYSWIFPKDGVINVGTEGNFAQLDEFLCYKGIDTSKILKKEAGIIPISGIQKLVRRNIALIGDSASMPNPLSGGGLTPIVYATQILAKNIHHLANYEKEVKRHPMSSPVLPRARRMLLQLSDKDLLKLLSVVTKPSIGRVKLPIAFRILRHPLLLLRLNKALLDAYQAACISRDYGW